MLISFSFLLPCTTAIVSGKYTVDGRPLLFKHRDSDAFHNKVMYFTDGKYDYIGLVNSKDPSGKEVWAGCNSAGFAIMNSASYNLKINDTTSVKDQEGIVIKKALQSCATVDDFEELLKSMPKPIGVEANFGVIDAFGGAAYFETDNFKFTKIDVNDTKIAPFGYVIRTNYSFTGAADDGKGYIRYLTAEELLYNAAARKDISPQFFLQGISRNLQHSLTKIDLRKSCPENSEGSYYVNLQDYIPRYSSVSSTLVQGVKPGESPDLTTMWTILGFQLCSVAVPAWVSAGDKLPTAIVADKTGNAPLCGMALKLKDKCFPIKRGSGKKYINLDALFNRKETGIMQRLAPLEDKILVETYKKLIDWRKNGIKTKEVEKFYDWLDKTILVEYNNLFSL